MTWTQFWDMHSGGGQKEDWAQIYIEASEDEAKVIFFNRFGHNPDRVTCTCCGPDYSIYGDNEELWIATAYHRNCKSIEQERVYDDEGNFLRWEPEQPYVDEPMDPGDRFYSDYRQYETLESYTARDDVLVIPADEIKALERKGSIPEQGYVWVGE